MERLSVPWKRSKNGCKKKANERGCVSTFADERDAGAISLDPNDPTFQNMTIMHRHGDHFVSDESADFAQTETMIAQIEKTTGLHSVALKNQNGKINFTAAREPLLNPTSHGC
jgi:hypothetical protein